jgi:DNA-binding Lrp family transcriptional regulator
MSLQEGSSIKGDFDRETLPTALQYFATNHPAGRLELLRGARRATLYFKGGNLIAAELDNKYGEEVIAQLLTWVNGQFEFYRGEMSEDSFAPAARVQKSISAVLLRAVAQSDALEQAAGRPVPKINPESVPTLEISEGGSAVQLDAGTWRLMSKIDGVRPVAQIAQDLGLSLQTVTEQLTTLAVGGIVRFATQVTTPVPQGFVAALYTAVIQIMGPLGDMIVDDGIQGAGLDSSTITTADLPKLIAAIEAEVASERRAKYRASVAQLLERFGLK